MLAALGTLQTLMIARPEMENSAEPKKTQQATRARKLTTITTHARSTIEVHFVRPINLHFRAKRCQKMKAGERT